MQVASIESARPVTPTKDNDRSKRLPGFEYLINLLPPAGRCIVVVVVGVTEAIAP